MAEIIWITRDRIINGIIAFAIAHVTYIYVFSLLGSVSWQYWYIGLGIVLLFSIYFSVVYNKHTPRAMQIASFIYATIISILFITVLRFSFTQNLPILAILFALNGIILFMISDSLIAYNRFKRKFKYADKLISLTYVLSQILLQSTQLVLM